jgi:hypothetical protein
VRAESEIIAASSIPSTTSTRDGTATEAIDARRELIGGSVVGTFSISRLAAVGEKAMCGSVATEVVGGAAWTVDASGAGEVCLSAAGTITAGDNRGCSDMSTVVERTRETENFSKEKEGAEDEMEKHL